MNDQNENLSHLIDEYSSDDSDQQLLGDVLGDVNQQYCLKRYQMIGHVMRHELPDKIDNNFCHNVMVSIRKIEVENKPVAERTKAASHKEAKVFWRWELLKPFAGMAVAASVAVVSITLWQSVSVTDSGVTGDQIVSAEQRKIDDLANQPIRIAVPASSTIGSSTLNNGMHWKVISDAPALERKLNAYLINHTEYSKSMQGLIPQARVAGYGSQK
jgi:negative regulator of sigma E activity